MCFNSLAPGKFEWNFRYLILQIISVIDDWGICCELPLRWMSLNFTDDESTWWHQAITWANVDPDLCRHMPLTWPQWVHSSPPGQNGLHFRYFKMHFHEWKALNVIWISLKFIAKGPIHNKSVLVQVMATSHYLLEPMMACLSSPLNKMATISHTTFSNTFLWMI